MRGKTARLLRRVAKTNPYGDKRKSNDDETLYKKSSLHDGSIVIAPGFRMTYRYLKKFYKQGRFTTTDLRAELHSVYLQKVREEMAEKKVPVAVK